MSIFHKYKYFLSFGTGNCVSNSQFQMEKNTNKQLRGRMNEAPETVALEKIHHAFIVR